MTTTALSVNLNKVALVRNTRHLGIPSVTRAATLCLQAGANGITVHPRPDERHIRAGDVHELAALMKAWPDREFNIEGNPFQNLMGFVHDLAARIEGRLVATGVQAFLTAWVEWLAANAPSNVHWHVEVDPLEI